MTIPVFTITRIFNAPRDAVWKAWTDPALFSRWFGPKGCTAQVIKQELRVGGILHTYLAMPNGIEIWGKFVYREVNPPSRLVWEHYFSDKDEGITRHPIHAGWPLKLLTEVDFVPAGDKTVVTLSWTPFDASAEELQVFADNIASMEQGWGGSFEQLDNFLGNQ